MGLDFQWLFESGPGRSVVLRPDFTIVAASDSYLRAAMQSRDAIVGRGLFEVFPDNPDDPHDGVKNLRASLERVRVAGTSETLPVQRYDVRAADGRFEERHWLPMNTPLVDASGTVRYIIHSIDDITDLVMLRRAAEEQDRSAAEAIRHEHRRLVEANNALAATNEELEAFCYSVAHDLRAPLRGIQGFSQALLEDHAASIDEKGQGYLQRVAAAALRMSQLIDDLLNLSRISRSPLSRQPVDLSAIAREVASDLRRDNVHVTIAEGLSAHADARLIRNIFENLLGNAFKFTAKIPSPRIEVGAEDVDGAPAFFVRDNGAGFDDAYASKLFAPFQRLHSEKEFSGTGIGLATVQRIARRHGGRTWASGAVDRGATIYFTLPD